ncbi:gasdermin-C-like, partial [Mus pahari]|uniref:gasdermin-C-like n=1 Tax=Mus pahari TaxID=10093 RepID=UPI000A30804E
MPYTFDWLSKNVAKKLQGRDLRPVKSLADAIKFCLFYILQETSPWLAFKTEYIPVEFTLLDVLEPNFPVPEPEVSAPINLKHDLFTQLKANVHVETIAGGAVGFDKSGGYDIEFQSTSIPTPKLESLQNRKLLDQLPSFMTNCRMDRKNLYVVTEAFAVTKDTVLEGISSVNLSLNGYIKRFVKGQVKGQMVRMDSISIPKGSVLAYKKQQLVVENNTCVILHSANAKKKTFSDPPNYASAPEPTGRYQNLIIDT